MLEFGLAFITGASMALDYFFAESCGDILMSFIRTSAKDKSGLI